MKNGNSLIVLFQGMFEGNIITCNPGWDESAQPVDEFDDVRAIQKSLKDGGAQLIKEADEESSCTERIVIMGPDRHLILVDQHV